ncbi:MAG: hypothetical protein SGPRY_013035, partial [Prymnesium sp.]
GEKQSDGGFEESEALAGAVVRLREELAAAKEELVEAKRELGETRGGLASLAEREAELLRAREELSRLRNNPSPTPIPPREVGRGEAWGGADEWGRGEVEAQLCELKSQLESSEASRRAAVHKAATAIEACERASSAAAEQERRLHAQLEEAQAVTNAELRQSREELASVRQRARQLASEQEEEIARLKNSLREREHPSSPRSSADGLDLSGLTLATSDPSLPASQTHAAEGERARGESPTGDVLLHSARMQAHRDAQVSTRTPLPAFLYDLLPLHTGTSPLPYNPSLILLAASDSLLLCSLFTGPQALSSGLLYTAASSLVVRLLPASASCFTPLPLHANATLTVHSIGFLFDWVHELRAQLGKRKKPQMKLMRSTKKQRATSDARRQPAHLASSKTWVGPSHLAPRITITSLVPQIAITAQLRLQFPRTTSD